MRHDLRVTSVVVPAGQGGVKDAKHTTSHLSISTSISSSSSSSTSSHSTHQHHGQCEDSQSEHEPAHGSRTTVSPRSTNRVGRG